MTTSSRPAAQSHSLRLAPGCWTQLVTLGTGSRRMGLRQSPVARADAGTRGYCLDGSVESPGD